MQDTNYRQQRFIRTENISLDSYNYLIPAHITF